MSPAIGVWYASLMNESDTKTMLRQAKAAVKNAQTVRAFHARRTRKDSQQRKDDIRIALDKLKEAMAPLRSEIGRFPYGPQTDAAEERRDAIRQASNDIQTERRKLWKLKGGPT